MCEIDFPLKIDYLVNFHIKIDLLINLPLIIDFKIDFPFKIYLLIDLPFKIDLLNRFLFQIDYQNRTEKNFDYELKKLYQVGEGYAHEKTETPADVIKESKAIYFRYLCNIQATQVTKREF